MGHSHDPADIRKLEVIVPHLLHHSSEHARDLEKWMRLAREAGKEEVAAELARAATLMGEAGLHLKAANDLLDG
jgi:hypothetical protein